LKIVARGAAMYELDLVGVQDVRWGMYGTESAGDYTFLYGSVNEDPELDTGFFVPQGILPTIKRVDFIGDMMYDAHSI
jgi:hypothetical protein